MCGPNAAPTPVETGTLHDPYTNATINFHRGAGIGESVQIDHIVAVGGWPGTWEPTTGLLPNGFRFANDPGPTCLRCVGPGQRGPKSDSQPGPMDAAEHRVPGAS